MQIGKINKKISTQVETVFNSRAAKYTQWVLILVVIFLIAWDINLYMADQNDTISQIIRFNAKNDLFVITWIWGILSAHLFVSRKEAVKKVSEPVAIGILLLISLIIFLMGKFISVEIPQYFQLILLISGGISGYYLWPQTFIESED